MAARGVGAAHVADVLANLVIGHEPLATARPKAAVRASGVIIGIHDVGHAGARLGIDNPARWLAVDRFNPHIICRIARLLILSGASAVQGYLLFRRNFCISSHKTGFAPAILALFGDQPGLKNHGARNCPTWPCWL